MNVLFAIPSICVGGAERVFAGLAGAVRAAGGRAGVLCLAEYDGRSEEFPADLWTEVRRLRKEDWIAGRGFSRILRGYDLIVLSLLAPPLRAALARAGLPCVHVLFSQLAWGAWYGSGIERTDRVDAIVADTHQAAAFVADQYPGIDVRTIPNGVDLSAWRPREMRNAECGMRSDETNGNGNGGAGTQALRHSGTQALVVGTVGRICPWSKHQAMFARLAARIQGERPDVRFRLLGSSWPAHRWLDDRLQAIAAEGGGAGIEISGHLSDDQLREEVRSLDVFALTSSAEGLPLALLEAMASGLPIVATAVGGVPEALLARPGEQDLARLVAVDDDDAAASWIKEYLDNPWLRRVHGARARATAEERYDLARSTGAWIELFEQVLAKRGKRSA